MIKAAFVGFAYMIAGIPFGVVVSRVVSRQDIRKSGSGNIGATNVARVVGKKWGILVLALDALKGFIVVSVSRHFFHDPTYANVVAIIAVLAHCYPIYLRFRGGKGVATALGVLLALSPKIVLIGIIVFSMALALTRIASSASLSAALAIAVACLVIQNDIFPSTAFIIAVVIWWKHQENIRRLIRKEEPKFF